MSSPTFGVFRGGNSRDLSAVVPGLRYNDAPIDYSRVYARTKHGDNRVMFDQHYAERNILLDAIVPTGAIPTDIWHLVEKDYPGRKTPDFRVRLTDNRTIYVETTRAGDPGTIAMEDTLPDISVAMTKWLLTSDEARESLGARTISFIPSIRPASRQERPFVEEMQRFVVTGRLADFESVYGKRERLDGYPVLSALSTLVAVRGGEGPAIHVQIPATTFGRWDGASEVLVAVRSKVDQRYDGFRPIWLAISMSNVLSHPDDVFEDVKRHLAAFEPFEKIILCNSNAAYVATAPAYA